VRGLVEPFYELAVRGGMSAATDSVVISQNPIPVNNRTNRTNHALVRYRYLAPLYVALTLHRSCLSSAPSLGVRVMMDNVSLGVWCAGYAR